MIRISRGAEPPELRLARRMHLARAVVARQAGREVIFEGWEIARAPLYNAQHRKCAYCERQQGLEGQPIEHFRPKGGARRGRTWDSSRYWWLAWNWDNLFFICTTCNSVALKGSHFPLKERTSPLPLPGRGRPLAQTLRCFAVSRESPMLIDPARDEPMDHIAWRPENPEDGAEHLRWRPMHKTARGKTTIELLHMRGALSEQVSSHIRHHIYAAGVVRIQAHIDKGDSVEAVAEWKALVERVFASDQPYHAACYDALAWFIDGETRERWGLVLPSPGAALEDGLLTDAADHRSLHGVPPEVVLAVRAREHTVGELVALISRFQSLPNTVLSEILDCSEAMIEAALRKLTRSRRRPGRPHR